MIQRSRHSSFSSSPAVYDVSNRESFNDVTMWLNEVDVYATSDRLVKMLVANKIDKVRFTGILLVTLRGLNLPSLDSLPILAQPRSDHKRRAGLCTRQEYALHRVQVCSVIIVVS